MLLQVLEPLALLLQASETEDTLVCWQGFAFERLPGLSRAEFHSQGLTALMSLSR